MDFVPGVCQCCTTHNLIFFNLEQSSYIWLAACLGAQELCDKLNIASDESPTLKICQRFFSELSSQCSLSGSVSEEAILGRNLMKRPTAPAWIGGRNLNSTRVGFVAVAGSP